MWKCTVGNDSQNLLQTPNSSNQWIRHVLNSTFSLWPRTVAPCSSISRHRKLPMLSMMMMVLNNMINLRVATKWRRKMLEASPKSVGCNFFNISVEDKTSIFVVKKNDVIHMIHRLFLSVGIRYLIAERLRSRHRLECVSDNPTLPRFFVRFSPWT
jgi:hypothetical protein